MPKPTLPINTCKTRQSEIFFDKNLSELIINEVKKMLLIQTLFRPIPRIRSCQLVTLLKCTRELTVFCVCTLISIFCILSAISLIIYFHSSPSPTFSSPLSSFEFYFHNLILEPPPPLFLSPSPVSLSLHLSSPWGKINDSTVAVGEGFNQV